MKGKEACRQYYWANREKRKDAMKCHVHGINQETLDALRAVSKGKCKICDASIVGLRKENLDHDHKTGFIRGLLCGSCNKGLGFFKDSPELMERAIRYLAKNKGRKVFMIIKGVEKRVTIEFSETELEFLIEKLRESDDESAKNLARALKENLAAKE